MTPADAGPDATADYDATAGNDATRYVFALGTGRCGSTLVHEVLARHASMGFLTNIEDRLGGARLGRPAAAAYRWLPAAATVKGRLRLAPSEGYRAMDSRVSPVLSTPVRDLVAADATPWLTGRMRDFFGVHERAHAAPVFLHKFTGWPRAGFLQAVWPEARFIHIVRDGRAVANSLLQMPWWRGYEGPSSWSFGPLPADYEQEWEASGRSFVLLAGLEWKLLMDAFEQAKAKIEPDRWLELRYEDVIADPRRHFELMLEFCGLSWNPAFEEGFRRYTFRSGRADAFRRDLGPDDVALLSSSLRDHLSRYGYHVE